MVSLCSETSNAFAWTQCFWEDPSVHLHAALAASISSLKTVQLLFHQMAACAVAVISSRTACYCCTLTHEPLIWLSADCDKPCAAFLQTFDLMGYAPSMWNKINIHIGGTYEGREETLNRFVQ